MLKKLRKKESTSVDAIKTEFLAAMSHELRTPLNSIIGYSEMMEQSAIEEGLSEYVGNLQKVIYSGRQLLKLVNDMLDLSKIDAGKLDAFLEEVSLKELVRELNAMAQPLLVSNKNTLEIIIKTDKDILKTDRQRLRQLLLYLLDNANKFTQLGKITLEITSLGSMVEFSITDTGMGMDSATMEKIFQRFTQGDSSITRKFGGTGLGLYLAKSFCELLGGSINMKSQKGKGSTFIVTLPENSVASSESAKDKKTSKFQGKTALLISYDPATVSDVMRDIKNMGFEVTQAKNGHEGLRVARSTRPNLIVLDISTSLSLTDSIRDQWITLSELKSDAHLSRIPLVVTTKELSQESLGFVLGEVDFLMKPIDVHAMMNKIKELIPDGVPTVLVVDDDESARDIMASAAKKVGWKFIEAVNGQEALDKMAKTRPSIILLDLMMPEMDGFTMIEQLQLNEKWRHIPVVIVSAKELSSDERMMLKKYSKGILQKGAYSRQELMDAICDQVK